LASESASVSGIATEQALQQPAAAALVLEAHCWSARLHLLSWWFGGRHLRRLPRDQRRAIQLHHLEGRSLAEVAHTMRRSKQAVVGLLFRGLRRLRRLLIGRDEV
jgi:hypothetical protein